MHGLPFPGGGWFRWLHVPSCCLGNKGSVKSLARVITMETRGREDYYQDRLPLSGKGRWVGQAGGQDLTQGLGSTTLSWSGRIFWEHNKYF